MNSMNIIYKFLDIDVSPNILSFMVMHFLKCIHKASLPRAVQNVIM